MSQIIQIRLAFYINFFSIVCHLFVFFMKHLRAYASFKQLKPLIKKFAKLFTLKINRTTILRYSQMAAGIRISRILVFRII